MATYKSEFSAGNGRLKEVSGLQYNDAAGGSLETSVLLAIGTPGFSLDGTTLSAVALGTGGYAGENGALATQGYVDQAVAGVTPGIPGDATYIDFPVASGVTFTAGSVLAMTTAGLAQATSASEDGSNAIGVFLSKPNTTTARVQVDGSVSVKTTIPAGSVGKLAWVDTAGNITNGYNFIPANGYATQLGIISVIGASGTNRVVLQPRIFGQVSA
jgi:hypothetical protein